MDSAITVQLFTFNSLAIFQGVKAHTHEYEQYSLWDQLEQQYLPSPM